MEKTVRDILRSLSITSNYCGYTYTLIACKLILENETRLHHITKEVYAKVAEIQNCNMYKVERNIRTVIFIMWERQREQFYIIAGHKPSTPPTVSEFLSILTNYIRTL